MTLEEMRARLAEIAAEMRSMHDEAGDAALSEERQGDWDKLDGEHETLSGQIKAAEARIEKIRGLAADPANVEKPQAPNVHIKPSDGELYDLQSLRQGSYSAEDFVERATDNAKRAIERASYGVRDKEGAQEHAESLLDEVDNTAGDLAKRMLVTGSKEYERAFTKFMRNGSDAMCTPEERQALVRAAQALGTDAQGGYAVPFQLDPTVILTSAGVINPIRQLARVERIVGKEWQGVTSAGTTVSRGAESAEAPASNFTLAQPTVTTNRVQGFVEFSMEVDLSWNALRTEITRQLVDAKAREEESFITGDGTGTNPEGINVALTGQDVATAAVDTFAVADLYALEEALDARWEPNASFVAHKSVYNAIRQFDTAGGANLWVMLGNGTPPRLLDYPDYRSTALPSLSAAKSYSGGSHDGGDTLMLFGDFQQFLIVDRIGMTVEMVPHVFGASRRPTGNRGVYAVWMNNSKILVPGAFQRLVVKQS